MDDREKFKGRIRALNVILKKLEAADANRT
jgi:hypothetical protein